MWALVAAAAAGAWAAWQWATNRPNEPEVLPPATRPANRPALAKAAATSWTRPIAGSGVVIDPAFQARLDACGTTAADITFANKWTALYLGDVLTLRERLMQMRHIIPYQNWSVAAQRVFCAFQTPYPHQ